MWACYKYTLKNAYLRKSTFIFMLITSLFLVLSPLLTDMTTYPTADAAFQATASNFYLIYWLLVASVMLSFYIGSKSTSFVADELEDGTFLTVVSKPIDRHNIVIGKFLAIITTNALYIVFSIFIPTMIIAAKINHPQTTGLLIGSAFMTSLYTIFFMIIILSVVLPLSIKISAKVVTSISIAIGVFVMVGSLVVPIILGISGGIWKQALPVGTPVTAEVKKSYEDKHNVYKFLAFIDVPQHFKTMFSAATNGVADQGPVAQMLAAPTKVTFEEVTLPNGTKVYKVVKHEDFISPLLLFILYGGVAAGLSVLTVNRFSKQDFM